MSDEEVLGKAYDSRLMKRLLGYLRPYWWQVVVALAAIILKAAGDVVGPYLTLVAIDTYLASSPGRHPFLARFLSPNPLIGVSQLGLLYLGILITTFFLEFT